MIKIIGHRGAAGYAMENTFASFEKARSMGVHMFEADIQKTIDNKLVVFHDNIVDRITTGSGYLSNYTYEQLLLMPLQDGSNIILFEDLCKYCNDVKIPLFAEVKNHNIAQDVLIILKKYLKKEDFIIGSFFHPQIHKLKQDFPEVSTCIVFEGALTDMLHYCQKYPVDFFSFGFESFNENIASEFTDAGLKYILWTLNSDVEIKKSIEYHPYGIITNYPDRVFKHLTNISLPTAVNNQHTKVHPQNGS